MKTVELRFVVSGARRCKVFFLPRPALGIRMEEGEGVVSILQMSLRGKLLFRDRP
ncbi:hypothetical protein C8J55DRAFT_528531 [Lentinula edodes]|uniref:Uncharacterized protein n=1 Tax=Lentinula lateritia TaxID=40482 RepID=A0A9W8ZS90_9AGAR|nr:hypothetical protein C8J55DRAFT_528531 [Lentinula edodes]